MSFLRRILGGRRPAAAEALVLDGYDDLAVVGESNYQDALRALVGDVAGRVRVPVEAKLKAEPNNPWDSNAISVWIVDRLVGYLSREDAAALRPGLLSLERRHGAPIALRGVIVGGGEGRPSFGVFLNLDATDFGLAGSGREHAIQRGGVTEIRTGLSNAIANDVANDDYDLGWQDGIPEDTLKAIAFLRVDDRPPSHFPAQQSGTE